MQEEIPIFSVGDVIRNTCSGERGEIVRLVPIADVVRDPKPNQPEQPAYIVVVPAGPFPPSREELWFPYEVKADHGAGTKPEKSGSGHD